jgi:hypothetical protein
MKPHCGQSPKRRVGNISSHQYRKFIEIFKEIDEMEKTGSNVEAPIRELFP